MKNKFKKIAALVAAEVMCVSTSLYYPANAAETDEPNSSVSEAEGVAIDKTNFPDDIFRSYIDLNFDKINDDILTADEISAAKTIESAIAIVNEYEDISDVQIKTLEGIQYLTELESIDVSGNMIANLELDGFEKLEYAAIDSNHLDSLKISNCPSLERLHCSYNDLTYLDFGELPDLKILCCMDNKLTNIDFTKFPTLEEAYCWGNSMDYFNIENMESLIIAECSNNNVERVFLDGCENLRELYCSGNRIESIDLSPCTNLASLSIGQNELKSLDISCCKKLFKVLAYDNHLTSLDLNQNEELTDVSVFWNSYQLRLDENNSFDLSKLPEGFDLEKVIEWNGGTVEGNILTFDEGAEEVKYKYDFGMGFSEEITLKKAPPLPSEPLAEGATRVTLYGINGELVPEEFVKGANWGFGTNIGIKNPSSPNGWMYTGPIFYLDSNPCIVDTTQLADLYKRADKFEVGSLRNHEKPEIVLNENGSLELIFTIEYDHTVFTFYDADSREKIEIPEESILTIQDLNFPDDAVFNIASNPAYFPGTDQSLSYNSCSMKIETSAGYYDVCDVIYNDDTRGRIRVDIYMEWHAKGDVNGDSKLTVADAVLVEKWLLGKSDVEFADWKGADFVYDNKLDVYDMIKLRQRLVEKEYVMPDIEVKYGPDMTVIADELKMYLGPDESYEVAAVIPKDTWLNEKGFCEDNDFWVFVEYHGQHGWIRIYEADNETMTVRYMVEAKKPVIYLYPEEETDVHVELELTESDLATTYPKYNNGWDVTAYPDGSLVNKADGSNHKYLFWDAKNCRTRYDMTKGFCVAGSDTEKFLKEKLTYMGLTEQEMNEFIVYWLPEMESNEYNLITFQGEAYTESSKLKITPTPDSLCRIFMVYTALDKPVNIEPQELETFERKGFTVVEWGGSEINKKTE